VKQEDSPVVGKRAGFEEFPLGMPPYQVTTLWDYCAIEKAKNADKEASDAVLLDTLKTYSTVPGAFKPLNETGSSAHLTSIRKRINKVVEKEIGLIEFKNKVDGEELAQSAY